MKSEENGLNSDWNNGGSVHMEKTLVHKREKWQSFFRGLVLNRHYYFMLAPFFILFFIFTVAPIISSVFISLTDFNMIQSPKLVGLSNYFRLFLNDDVFLTAIRNTVAIALVAGPISYLACWLIAWQVNEFGSGLRTLFTLVFYIPSMTASAIEMWRYFFSSDSYGLVNAWLFKLGFLKQPVEWLTNPNINLSVIIGITIWLSLGVPFLAFVAGLQTLDRSLFESGAIDGIRNRWQEMWFITLPQMKPQLMFGAVMQIAASFSVASIPMSLTGFPSINYSTHTVISHVIDFGNYRYEMGYACAISTVLFIMIILAKRLLTAFLNRVGT